MKLNVVDYLEFVKAILLLF